MEFTALYRSKNNYQTDWSGSFDLLEKYIDNHRDTRFPIEWLTLFEARTGDIAARYVRGKWVYFSPLFKQVNQDRGITLPAIANEEVHLPMHRVHEVVKSAWQCGSAHGDPESLPEAKEAFDQFMSTIK